MLCAKMAFLDANIKLPTKICTHLKRGNIDTTFIATTTAMIYGVGVTDWKGMTATIRTLAGAALSFRIVVVEPAGR